MSFNSRARVKTLTQIAAARQMGFHLHAPLEYYEPDQYLSFSFELCQLQIFDAFRQRNFETSTSLRTCASLEIFAITHNSRA